MSCTIQNWMTFIRAQIAFIKARAQTQLLREFVIRHLKCKSHVMHLYNHGWHSFESRLLYIKAHGQTQLLNEFVTQCTNRLSKLDGHGTHDKLNN